MSRFVLYRYTASNERETVSLSLESQLEDMRLFLSTLPEAEIVADFVEDGMDDDFGREALNRAMSEARDKGAALLAARPDRLSKRPAFFRKIVEDQSLDLTVAQFPGATKWQILNYVELKVMEEDFRRLQAEHQRAQRSAMRGTRPSLTVEELKRLAEPLRAQGLSLRQIARHLDDLGYPARRGGHWQASQVMRMLKVEDAQR